MSEKFFFVVSDLLDGVVLVAAAGDDGEVAQRLHREQLAEDKKRKRHLNVNWFKASQLSNGQETYGRGNIWLQTH